MSAPESLAAAAGSVLPPGGEPFAVLEGISPARLRLWGLALVGIGLAPVAGAFGYGFHDWPAFWSAGATVGTPDLLDPVRHTAWQRAHGLPEAFFPYPPGVAWLYAPFATLPLAAGFLVHGLAMLLAAAAAALVGGRLYGVDRSVALLAVLGFAPVGASVVLGQNAPLGLLLYKPTYALPLAGLLLVRRRWVELAIAGGVAVGWYLAGLVATAGDPAWPLAWLDGIRGYLAADFAGNADKTVSLPGLLARLPVPGWVPVVAGAVVALAAVPVLARARPAEAGALACLVGVAVSPHAWGYDAALAVPALLWLLGPGGRERVGEPWRTRLVLAAYLLAPLWLVSRQTVVSAVAVVVLGLVAVWLGVWFAGALRARRVGRVGTAG